MYAPKQGYALAQAVDNTLAGLPDDLTNTVGTLAVDLTYDDVLEARQYLDDNDVPLEDRFIAISPAQEVGFMKIDQFVHRDYDKLQGERVDAKDRSYIGSWLDIPIHKSTNVEGDNTIGHDNVMAHKTCFQLVMQMKATTHVMFDIDYLAHKAVVEHIYGTAALRDSAATGRHGVWMKGR